MSFLDKLEGKEGSLTGKIGAFNDKINREIERVADEVTKIGDKATQISDDIDREFQRIDDLSNAVGDVVGTVRGVVTGYKEGGAMGALNALTNGSIVNLANVLSNLGARSSDPFKTTGKANIHELMNTLVSGVARPNRYEINFNLPKGVKAPLGVMDSRVSKTKQMEKQFNDKRAVSMKAHTLMVPAKALPTMNQKYNNLTFKIVGGAIEYEMVTVSFFMNGQMDVRKYFDLWQNICFNQSNGTANFYDEYVSDIEVLIEDVSGRGVYRLVLIEAFPVNVSALELTASGDNQFLNQSVTFAYKYAVSSDSNEVINRFK